MTDDEPTVPQKPEREPASYERALEAVRALKAAGVEDPFDEDDPRVRESMQVREEWLHEHNLHMRGVGTPEKARDIVRAALMMLEAGYDRLIDEALEKLRDEHADALREGAGEPVRILGEAIDALENRLGQRDPKKKVPAIVSEKVDEARSLAEQGKITDAVGILTLALFDPRFKRLPKKVLDGIRELRDNIKSRG